MDDRHSGLRGKLTLTKYLALEKLEKDWTVYPVLHLDLNTQKYDTPESLTSILNDNLCTWESRYGARESETSLSLRFQGIIRRACEQTGRRVVILIDEYDKPMLQAIGNEALQNEYLTRERLSMAVPWYWKRKYTCRML